MIRSDVEPKSTCEPDAEPRYEDRGRISEGGMGEIRRVYDRRLERDLARKTLLWDHFGDKDLEARFLREARIAARLQHPGIPPVHDLGTDVHGRPWMTMREIRGRTLRELIALPQPVEEGVVDPLVTLRRLISWFSRACEAVAFAHAQGTLHRDLKPENIMIGEFGEVQVVDWGLARCVDEPETPSRVGVRRPEERLTEVGAILGTPGYMAPEQARGENERVGTASDVFALGAILYEILSGQRAVMQAMTEPLATRDGEICMLDVEAACGATRPCPPELAALARDALRFDPATRIPDAGLLAARLNAWLDGVRRVEDAGKMIAEARALQPEIDRDREAAAVLRREAEMLLSSISDPTQAFSVEKERAWALEDRASELERRAAETTVHSLSRLEAGLAILPTHAEAHDLLATHYRRELDQAERAHDGVRAAQAEVRLRAHDRGQHRAWLSGEGTITLVTDPPGAWVELFTLRENRRRLEAVHVCTLGTTPLFERCVPRGSHILVLRCPGRAEVRYPVSLGRQEDWVAGSPQAGGAPLFLPPAGVIGADDAYVPAGWFWSGGDPGAGDALPSQRIWVDGFVMKTHPVTTADYLAFIDSIRQTKGEDVAQCLAPRQTRAGAGEGQGAPIFRLASHGAMEVDPGAGEGWEPDRPVTQVSWSAARAYASWLAERTNLTWRLPHALEREKAARGVDGRRWPWGDHLDTAWFCNLRAHPGKPSRTSIHAYPLDVSVYGIYGLAGNVRDWCSNAWSKRPSWLESGKACLDADTEGALREVRGGAWSSEPQFCRPTARYAINPDSPFGSGGFRLVRSLNG